MDTNVLYAGLRSNRGASYALLTLLRAGNWTLLLSNTIATEYEEILLRESGALNISLDEISKLLDDICALAERCHVSSSWEPLLPDVDDESFAQLASEAKADFLVTYNQADFEPIRTHVRVVTPREFLATLRTES